MRTFFGSLAIVAGLMLAALVMPAKAHANGYYAYYGGGCCYARNYAYYPRYSKHHRARNKVIIVIINKHRRHYKYPYYMARPYMGGYGFSYRY